MFIKKFHIICAFAMIWNFSYSQQYTNYTVDDGLPSNHVYQLTQDSEGFIWAVTDKGIVKYNGTNFKTFTTRQGLPTNDIWAIRSTDDGKVWYFSKSPKLGYIQNDSVYAFASREEGEVLDPVFQSIGYGRVTIGNSRSSHNLSEKSQWEKIPFGIKSTVPILSANHPQVSQIVAKVGQDSLYFLDNDLQIIDRLKRKKGLVSEPIRGQLNDSIVFWVNADGYTICNLNKRKFYERDFMEELGVSGTRFARLVSINNRLQITGANFVGLLDDQFHIIDVTFFPKELKVHFACIDADETIWMASFNKGFYKFPKAKRDIKYGLLSNKVSQFSHVDGQLVASIYDRGFFVYEPNSKEFQPFIEEEGYILSASEVDEIDTNFYLTGHKIITHKDGRMKVLVSGTSGLKLNNLGRQFVYHEGFLFGNFSGGINKLDPITLDVVERYAQVGVYNMLVFKSQLFVGTPNGLKSMVNGKLEEVNFGTTPFHKPILNLKQIDSERILITTDGYGAFITNLSTVTPLENTSFLSVQDAFIENNRIWLATDRGVWSYLKKENEFVFEKMIDESDGLPTRNINAVSVQGDQLIVGTDNGVAVLSKNVEKAETLLDLYFESANFNDQPLDQGTNSFTYTQDNSTSFTISNIDFSGRRDGMRYSYKLEPIQDNWTPTGSGSLLFTDLKPNAYRLKIRSGGIEKTIAFKVLPLWWQKKGVQIAGLIVLLLVTLSLVYFILNSIQKKQTRRLVQEKELAQIQLKALRSQMNPHFVFNSLAAIQYYINNNDFEASEGYLVKFSKLIRTFFELTKESEITIADEVELLKNYLDLEKLRFQGKFDYRIFVDPKLNGKTGKIPAMLLQPIVENAVNHGIFNKEEKGNVIVEFQKITDTQITVSIMDDGVGFANTKKGRSSKIKSSNVLQDRLYFLNRSLRWKIDYSTREAFPEHGDRGNISTFTIKRKA